MDSFQMTWNKWRNPYDFKMSKCVGFPWPKWNGKRSMWQHEMKKMNAMKNANQTKQMHFGRTVFGRRCQRRIPNPSNGNMNRTMCTIFFFRLSLIRRIGVLFASFIARVDYCSFGKANKTHRQIKCKHSIANPEQFQLAGKWYFQSHLIWLNRICQARATIESMPNHSGGIKSCFYHFFPFWMPSKCDYRANARFSQNYSWNTA